MTRYFIFGELDTREGVGYLPTMPSKTYDVIIIGAGPSGLMCAIEAGRRGRTVLLVDHAPKAGGKIPISGGGHCNFTNTGASASQYFSNNPHFAKSALSRFPAERFVERVVEYGLPFHEKKHGELFLDGSAHELVTCLLADCAKAGVDFQLGSKVESVEAQNSPRFSVKTGQGIFGCESLVVATGGLSIPKAGATGIGYDLARQFGLKVLATAPALDGFVFNDAPFFKRLAGVSLECVVSCNGNTFRENVLFTHLGLSGPAVLQASLYWNPGDPLTLDLLPGMDCFEWFIKEKRKGRRSPVKSLLRELLVARLADVLCEKYFASELPLPQVSEKELEVFCRLLKAWTLLPENTVGYSKAEVTRGGVDTDELSSKTLESKKCPGLYFIGEVVDVTGWLGGYNLQWAWSSGWAAGQSV